MSTSSRNLRQFVRQALVAKTGVPSPHLAQLASAFDQLCDQLRARLHPIFGNAAIVALFARAHHTAMSEFPWLGEVVPKDGQRCSQDGVEGVRGLEPELMAQGLAAVLAYDIGLLSTFIGEDLVMPLVEEAWGDASLGDRRDRPASTEGNQ